MTISLGQQTRAAVAEPELPRAAALHAGGGGDLHPLEHVLELAAVGVCVHPHRAADGPGDVDAELDPRQSGPGRARGDRRQPRAAAAHRFAAAPRRSRASSRSSFTTRPATPSSAISRFEPEPTTFTGLRPAAPRRAARAAPASLPGAREVLGRATRAHRRQASEREVGRHGRGQRQGRSSRHQPAPERIDVSGAHHQAQVALAQQVLAARARRPRTSAASTRVSRRRRLRPPRRSSARSPPGAPRRARAPDRRRAPRSRRARASARPNSRASDAVRE